MGDSFRLNDLLSDLKKLPDGGDDELSPKKNESLRLNDLRKPRAEEGDSLAAGISANAAANRRILMDRAGLKLYDLGVFENMFED